MHTPGPWSATETCGDFYVEPTGDSTVAICSVLPIDSKGALGDYARGPITHANAALIAAAPELLAHLKIVAFHLRRDDFRERTNLRDEALDRIEATIAKAEGGAT